MPGQQPLQLFYSYAHEDEQLRDELAKHLRLLERQGLLRSCHDRQIRPGAAWRAEIDAGLRAADIVLLLVSPDFLDSDYCYDVELAEALRRHNLGECAVVPVVLRTVDLTAAPFAGLQALPRDARAVTLWADRDEAFRDVAAGIRRLVQERVAAPPAAAGPDPEGPAISAADLTRIRAYRELFDRRAFSVPCIFENSLDSVRHACEQIAFALVSGQVRDTGEVMVPERRDLYEVPRRSDFDSGFCRATLSQVGRYLDGIHRGAASLRLHLLDSGLDVGLREFEQNLGFIDVEMALNQLIDAGATRAYVRDALARMDQVDSSRNAVLDLVNSLLEPAGVPAFPLITRTTELIVRSADMAPYDWQQFWIGSHEKLRPFLADD